MKLWAGRFQKETDTLVNDFNSSIGFDARLYKQDIQGSIAHAAMLGRQGIIEEHEAEKIINGLKTILSEIEGDGVEFSLDNEDIHMNIEAMLTQRIGDAGKRLHTARSRNDQVAVDTEGLDYIRITDCDHWCVGMRPDDPLAEKEFIRKEDLIGKPLILPERVNVQSELANWFGKDFSKLQIAFTSNLGTNAGVMAANGLGYPVSIEGAAKYWREDILVQRRISPEITTSTVIAWRRNIPYSLAVRKMIEEINAFQA